MARQKLGQHFLRSQGILERIAHAAAPGAACGLAVEIGPGRGALTDHLLRRFERVVAIELDHELAMALEGRDPKLTVVEGNAIEAGWDQWGGGVLAGNLPYYAATPIISRYVRRPGPLTQATFLIQREVAERITAKPSTRDYGYFSVECQLLADCEYLFTVPPGAFQPPPKVDSAVIRLTPRTPPPDFNTEPFLTFVSRSFRQKRKTLRNNLSPYYSREILEGTPGLERRAEALSVDEFAALFHALNAPRTESGN
jgi:16S rRNA (adenine1518-N6/adenine1519-N6)-dimethyltransferase